MAWQPVGLAMGVYDVCARYVAQREQFGAPIGSFQLVQERLVRMLGSIQVRGSAKGEGGCCGLAGAVVCSFQFVTYPVSPLVCSTQTPWMALPCPASANSPGHVPHGVAPDQAVRGGAHVARAGGCGWVAGCTVCVLACAAHQTMVTLATFITASHSALTTCAAQFNLPGTHACGHTRHRPAGQPGQVVDDAARAGGGGAGPRAAGRQRHPH